MNENLIRSDRAGRVLHYYRVVVMGDSENEPEQAVARDLLTDLKHRLGPTVFDQVLTSAIRHHAEEVAQCSP